ncbi:MAG: toll/interleukin-1 receptor domain-containing protein [Dinghuibacter sp.]|nr:toll/interleukin-1 receptor domain-containing protein [Dinghuibacter sp.]
MIENSHWAGQHPGKRNDVFISHSHKDYSIAKEICDYLEFQGLHCWLAPRSKNIIAGEKYATAISEAIEACSVFVVILSENSIISKGVLGEVELAHKKQKGLLCISINGTEAGKALEYYLDPVHRINLKNDVKKDQLNEIYQACLHHLGKPLMPGKNFPFMRQANKFIQRNRLLFMLLVVFAISGFIYIRIKDLQENGIVTVQVIDKQPRPALPFISGTVWLKLGHDSKPEKISLEDDAVFREVPARFKSGNINLRFEAKGFETIDTTLPFPKELVKLYIQRNNDYALYQGKIVDGKGVPQTGIKVMMLDLISITNEEGIFNIQIPTEKQQKEPTLTVFNRKNEGRDYTGAIPTDRSKMAKIVLE